MKNLLYTVLSVFGILISQEFFSQTPPWLSPLEICTSTDGVNFSAPTIFQDSAGVSTVIELGPDTLIAAFQWFPMPFQSNAGWDKVAVKFSYDGGVTWTSPTTCAFNNSPVGFQRPFDPALT